MPAGRGVSIESATGLGEDSPGHPPQVYRVVREMLPRETFGPEELLRWLEGVQLRNQWATRAHQKRRAARLTPVGAPP